MWRQCVVRQLSLKQADQFGFLTWSSLNFLFIYFSFVKRTDWAKLFPKSESLPNLCDLGWVTNVLDMFPHLLNCGIIVVNIFPPSLHPSLPSPLPPSLPPFHLFENEWDSTSESPLRIQNVCNCKALLQFLREYIGQQLLNACYVPKPVLCVFDASSYQT